jgi:hypothetical protein
MATVAKVRTFNGMRYTHYANKGTEYEAHSIASALRKHGNLVRVIRNRTKGVMPYTVYFRKG